MNTFVCLNNSIVLFRWGNTERSRDIGPCLPACLRGVAVNTTDTSNLRSCYLLSIISLFPWTASLVGVTLQTEFTLKIFLESIEGSLHLTLSCFPIDFGPANASWMKSISSAISLTQVNTITDELNNYYKRICSKKVMNCSGCRSISFERFYGFLNRKIRTKIVLLSMAI